MDDESYINQLSLKRRGIRRNQAFFKDIWYEDLHDAYRIFDRLTPKALERVHEPDMTPERFVVHLNDIDMVQLQIGAPHPHTINYCAIAKLIDDEYLCAWLHMPYTPKNFEHIAHAYENAFDKRLQDEPISKGRK